MVKAKLDPADLALFRQAVHNVKPLSKGKAKLQTKPVQTPIRKSRAKLEEAEPADPFSDFESLEPVDSETVLSFARSGISPTTLRTLRRGSTKPQAVLD